MNSSVIISSNNSGSESVFELREIKDLFKFIGVNAGIITFIIVCMAIYPSVFYIVAFIIGVFVNIQLNKILKYVFKEPRPSNKYSSNSPYEGGVDGKWGFPSGHAQVTSYAFIYLLLVKPKKTVFLILLGIFLCISVIQRYVYNKHTLTQLIAGLFIGSTFAFFYIWFITFIRPYIASFN